MRVRAPHHMPPFIAAPTTTEESFRYELYLSAPVVKPYVLPTEYSVLCTLYAIVLCTSEPPYRAFRINYDSVLPILPSTVCKLPTR